MDKVKQWVALTAFLVMAVLAAGWFLLVSPQNAQAADLTAQADSQKAASATLRGQLAVLVEQAEQLPQQQAELAAVAAKIPGEASLPTLIRALTDAAQASGVELVSVAPGAPTPVTTAASTAVTAKATAGATAVAPAAVGAPAAATGTLAAVPVTLSAAGGFYQVEQFLAALEDLPRAFRVSGLTVVPGADPVASKSATAADTTSGKALITTITGQVFLAQGRSPETAVTVPADAPPTTPAAAAAGK